jgi:hypothetical protein
MLPSTIDSLVRTSPSHGRKEEYGDTFWRSNCEDGSYMQDKFEGRGASMGLGVGVAEWLMNRV